MKYAPKGFQEDDTPSPLMVKSAIAKARGGTLCPREKGNLAHLLSLAHCYHCDHVFDPRAEGSTSDVLCPCCA